MRTNLHLFILTLFTFSLFLISPFGQSAQAQGTISFGSSELQGANLTNPTSLQFGPDGRLYVSQRRGLIKIFDVERTAANSYAVTDSETISLVKQIPNHDDDGVVNPSVEERQITGILVTGTATEPVLYVSSSDPREGAGNDGNDLNLDTNSGILSRLTLVDGSWDKVDLVRGLPRSEENHSVNGMALDDATNILYLTSGGHTNAGAPSFKFAYSTEYALSAAILSIDLNALNSMAVVGDGDHKYVYDIPTLDDPTRGTDGEPDNNDPFGGNDGLNQAKVVPGGPVQIYSPGYRNAYDLVITQAGQLFTIDNGANGSWGGFPEDESENCTNDYPEGEPGSINTTPDGRYPVNNKDNLHLVEAGFYGGHAAPVRGNPNGAGLYTHDEAGGVWRNSTTGPDNERLPADWPPVPEADPRQCDFINPGDGDMALATFPESTNGLSEYTTDNFDGALKGDLIAAGFDGVVWQLDLGDEPVTNDGSASAIKNELATGLSLSLDVVAQAPNQPFPGTIWVAVLNKGITILEPSDYDGSDQQPVCLGTDDPALDEDEDGYTNADEIDNGNNPCSPADKPADNDNDLISDLNDDDDDNDGDPDISDPFAIDSSNGQNVTIPVDYQLFNGDPGTGFWGVGLTGLMSNGATDYQALYPDPQQNVVGGGTAGFFTVNSIPGGTATAGDNTQQYGFQFGVGVDDTLDPFDVRVNISGPFFSNDPQADQTHGMYIGTGDQDNYLKIAAHANDGAGGIQVLLESNGAVVSDTVYPQAVDGVDVIDFILLVDPATGAVQPKAKVGSNPILDIGPQLMVDGPLLDVLQNDEKAMAVGMIASAGSGPNFSATWDRAELSFELFESNQAPAFQPIDAQTFGAGELVEITLVAADANNDALTFLLIGGPDGMSLTDNQDNTVLLNWMPDREDIGQHSAVVRVTDPSGASNEISVFVDVIDINNAPQIESSPSDAEINVGTEFSLDILAADINGDMLTAELTESPAGMTLVESGSNGWQLRWQPARAHIGTHAVSIIVEDPYEASDTLTFDIVVLDNNVAPTIRVDDSATSSDTPVAINITENDSVEIIISVSDTDSEIASVTPTGLPDYAFWTDNGDGTAMLTLSPKFTDSGAQTVTITATDEWGAAQQVALAIQVADLNNPPVVGQAGPSEPATIVRGETFSYPVSFTDPDGDALTLSLAERINVEGLSIIDNGDGTGMVQWNTSESDTVAIQKLVVVATDAKGGETEHEITVQIENETDRIFMPILVSN